MNNSNASEQWTLAMQSKEQTPIPKGKQWILTM